MMDIYPTEPRVIVKCTRTLSVSSGRQVVKRTLLGAKNQVIGWMQRSRKAIHLYTRLELGKQCLCRIEKIKLNVSYCLKYKKNRSRHMPIQHI